MPSAHSITNHTLGFDYEIVPFTCENRSLFQFHSKLFDVFLVYLRKCSAESRRNQLRIFAKATSASRKIVCFVSNTSDKLKVI